MRGGWRQPPGAFLLGRSQPAGRGGSLLRGWRRDPRAARDTVAPRRRARPPRPPTGPARPAGRRATKRRARGGGRGGRLAEKTALCV